MKTMHTIKTILLATLVAFTLACGYGSKTYPPVAGSVPALTQLNPASATAGDAAFTLTVTGSNFGAKAVVNWNGVAQTTNTTYMTGNQLTVAIPASAIAAPGTVAVTVTNPGTKGTGMYGNGGTLPETSNSMDFTIN